MDALFRLPNNDLSAALQKDKLFKEVEQQWNTVSSEEGNSRRKVDYEIYKSIVYNLEVRKVFLDPKLSLVKFSSIVGTNYGRFTKGLAYTVLMKLYMHEQNWAKAVECGRELMKPEYGYRLMDNYKDIFTLENEGNAETIWACVCSRSVNQQMWLAHVISSEYPTKNPNIQKWGGYRVLWNFYHTFDSADKRLEVLVGDFVAEDGTHYNEENPGSVLIKGAMPVKYGEDPDATGEESQVDWIVYRYADVLTLLAEAIVREGNTVTPEAVELLNMVHTRAGLPAYTMADFAGADAFLEAVLTERGHELWFEGVRRSDLIRYGRYIEYARKYKQSPTAQDYMTLMPLPQSVIDESKGKIIQNPGY